MSSATKQTLTWRKPRAQAERLDGVVSERTIRNAVTPDKLPVARIGAGRNYLISDEHIDEWLRSLITAAPAPTSGGARNARKGRVMTKSPSARAVAGPCDGSSERGAKQ